jgi:hypothetical protein
MTSAETPPPAMARQPTAASGPAQRRLVQGRPAQRRWSLARRRKSSQGAARVSSGTPADGSGTSNCAAFGTAAGTAASAPIRSRRERSSSIVRIWSVSGSSTTSNNELPHLLGTGRAYFPRLSRWVELASLSVRTREGLSSRAQLTPLATSRSKCHPRHLRQRITQLPGSVGSGSLERGDWLLRQLPILDNGVPDQHQEDCDQGGGGAHRAQVHSPLCDGLLKQSPTVASSRRVRTKAIQNNTVPEIANPPPMPAMVFATPSEFGLGRGAVEGLRHGGLGMMGTQMYQLFGGTFITTVAATCSAATHDCCGLLVNSLAT